MTIETLLSRLDKVRRSGTDRYSARCPAHDDRGPSLAIRELDDGRLLVHCFAGCSTPSVLQAIGLEMATLFPDAPLTHQGKPERRPFPAADVLRCVALESLVVAVAGSALLDGRTFAEADRQRLMLAVSRLQAASTAAGVRHG